MTLSTVRLRNGPSIMEARKKAVGLLLKTNQFGDE